MTREQALEFLHECFVQVPAGARRSQYAKGDTFEACCAAFEGHGAELLDKVVFEIASSADLLYVVPLLVAVATRDTIAGAIADTIIRDRPTRVLNAAELVYYLSGAGVRLPTDAIAEARDTRLRSAEKAPLVKNALRRLSELERS